MMKNNRATYRQDLVTALLVLLCLIALFKDFALSNVGTSSHISNPPEDIPRNEVRTITTSQPAVNESMSYMKNLADVNSFLGEVEKLYRKYGAEIAAYRPEMKKWCEVTNSCKFGDYEAEMLYMLVREHKPQNVFEMAPNRGYSSHWILKALHLNDNTSRLHSFDIHETSVTHMNETYKARWVFTLGDYAKLYDSGKLDMDKFDFIFVDALHEPEFARGYCRRLFANHKTKNTVVAIHDIVASPEGGGRESEEVYKYLAMAPNAQNVFTFSRFAMPNQLYEPQADTFLPVINQVRADMGIVKPCGNDCGLHTHDMNFFENNDAPTIFFTLN